MSGPRFDALEDFAGPGGWDEGARLLELRFYGVDYDKAACETARAAGHHREQADVTEHASPAWAHGLGHVSSPSCTLFSMAGSGIGVPQTRERAVLGASRVRKVQPPEPTHSEHTHDNDLFGASRLPWISWGEALGLPPDAAIRPARGAGMIKRHGERPDHLACDPAPTVIGKARSWEIDRRTNSKGPRGTTVSTVPVPSDRPAPTLTSKAGGQWVLRASNQANSAIRPDDRPAPTMLFAHACNDVRLYPKGTEKPGEPMRAGDRPAESTKLEVWEAGVLQSFPADYRWQGTRSKQYEQVGNAIPPLLAAHVLSAVTGIALRERGAA